MYNLEDGGGGGGGGGGKIFRVNVPFLQQYLDKVTLDLSEGWFFT